MYASDISIQINAISRQVCDHFDEIAPGKTLDVILRNFASAIDISVRKQQVQKLLLVETYTLDALGVQYSPDSDMQDSYRRNIYFLHALKNIPLLELATAKATYDGLVPWIHRDQDEFFRELKGMYSQIFSYFDYQTTVHKLVDVLKMAIERSYRSDAIKHHIQNRQGIEEKLAGIMDWQMHHRNAWLANVHTFMPECNPQGFQNVTVAEIALSERARLPGQIGGKTVKFAQLADLNIEFMLSQATALGKSASTTTDGKFRQLRKDLMYMLIARRYIFPEAIDQIMALEKDISTSQRRNIEKYETEEIFREFIYTSFLDRSHDMMEHIYHENELLPDENGTHPDEITHVTTEEKTKQ